MTQDGSGLRARFILTFSSQGVFPSQEDFHWVDREKGIFVVADGFGGPISGLKASKTACEAVRSFLFKEAGDLEATLPFILRSYFSLAGNVLFNSLIFANQKLRKINQGKSIHERGGASLIAGFVDGDLLAIANVGVCEAWLFRDQRQVKLVMPRNFKRLCDPLSIQEKKNLDVPLIALGISEDLEPEIVEYKIKQGDWVIFASDGIPEGLVNQLVEIQRKNIKKSLEKSMQDFNQILQDSIYHDNATLVAIIF